MHFPYTASDVEALIVTHAHMDHSGNIPNLIKHGFKGDIYCTAPTVDLCKIMLRDSAFLQEHDLFWVNKIRARHHLPPAVPLYTVGEAEASLRYFEARNYDEPFTVAPGIEITLQDAGHILGAASIRVDITENNRKICLAISGDIGRPNIPITRDPSHVFEPDILVMESTYGNRNHTAFDTVEEDLAQMVRETSANGGKVIIPAFALGRTQLLVYLLHKLYDEDRIPEIPIFVDSPLTVHATAIFQKYLDLLDREADRIFLQSHQDPFKFRMLKYVEDAFESRKINDIALPCIIISASGMAEGGRILHHLRNNIDNPKNLILLVGYSAKETLARKLADGQEEVSIFGEKHRVRAKVRVLDSFSAHSSREDLVNYARRTSPEKLQNIFLVHGEPDQSLPLRDTLRGLGYKNVHYPEPDQVYTF
jgi:metallo-beta-lactamase family protein